METPPFIESIVNAIGDISITEALDAIDREFAKMPTPNPDFWRCRTCGCLWRDNHDDTVSLGSAKQTSCAACEVQPTATACEPLFRAVFGGPR